MYTKADAQRKKASPPHTTAVENGRCGVLAAKKKPQTLRSPCSHTQHLRVSSTRRPPASREGRPRNSYSYQIAAGTHRWAAAGSPRIGRRAAASALLCRVGARRRPGETSRWIATPRRCRLRRPIHERLRSARQRALRLLWRMAELDQLRKCRDCAPRTGAADESAPPTRRGAAAPGYNARELSASMRTTARAPRSCARDAAARSRTPPPPGAPRSSASRRLREQAAHRIAHDSASL